MELLREAYESVEALKSADAGRYDFIEVFSKLARCFTDI